MNDSLKTVIIVAALILLLVLSVVMQAFRARRSPLGRVIKIHQDIQHIEKFYNDTEYRHRVGRINTQEWDKYREKVGFLPEELREELTKLFDNVNITNFDTGSSSKIGSDIYAATLDMEKIKALASCREKLKEWISTNIHNPEYLPRKFGLFRH